MISSGCFLTAFVVCAPSEKAKPSLQQRLEKFPSGCVCAFPGLPVLLWRGGPSSQDQFRITTPERGRLFYDLALCSPIFHKTTGQTQSTALFPSHPPSDLASEGKAPWRKGVAGFRGTLRSTKLKTHSRTDVTLLGYSSQAGRQSHFLGNAPTPRCLLFADRKLEGKLL